MRRSLSLLLPERDGGPSPHVEARFRYDPVVTGAGSSARYEWNLFSTRRSGVAVRVEKGGTATEGDGNELAGGSPRRSSGD